MRPADLVTQISFDLNDQEPGYEFERWPYEQLLTYVQEAVNYAAQMLKDLFIERVVVKLEKGDVWQNACECDDITRVLGETDATGSRILRRLRRMKDDESLIWPGSTTERCGYGTGYVMNGYVIDSTTDRSFKVLPPVPGWEKKDRFVLVECFVPPDATTGADVPDDLVAAVKQWALFRALAIDSENNAAVAQLAVQHRDTFYKLVQDVRTMHDMELRRDGSDGGVQPARNSSAG